MVHAHQAPAVSFSSVCPTPSVLTLHHERTDRLVEYYSDFPEVTFVAISRRQAGLFAELPIRHVVYHGLDVDHYELGNGRRDWLAFVGRLAPEKGPHIAIVAAVVAGVPLRMAGRPHWADREFFEGEIEPRLARAARSFHWEGELSFAPKLDLLRGACATLFPIDWEEPFGLVMIESMLVGTPIIAFARGSAPPEVVGHGVTGFLVKDVSEMTARIAQVGTLDHAGCRERPRERWSALRMAREYERIYAQAARANRDRRSLDQSGAWVVRWPRAASDR